MLEIISIDIILVTLCIPFATVRNAFLWLTLVRANLKCNVIFSGTVCGIEN